MFRYKPVLIFVSIRVGASGYATLSSSTTVWTTYTEVTFSSNSHVFTTSYPITTTKVTLVPMPTSTPSAMTMTNISSRSVCANPSQTVNLIFWVSRPPRVNIGAIVGVAVALTFLLIAALVVWILVRKRRRRQTQRHISETDASFFTNECLVSALSPYTADSALSERRSSVRASSVLIELSGPDGDMHLDQLDHSAPPLQVASASSISEPIPGLFLRYSMETLEVSSSSGGLAFSDTMPHSPMPSSINSSSSRQEQLASEVSMVRQEISALERPPRDVEEGYVEDAGQRIEALQARIRQLEREQATLRLEVEMSMREVSPPDYASAEG